MVYLVASGHSSKIMSMLDFEAEESVRMQVGVGQPLRSTCIRRPTFPFEHLSYTVDRDHKKCQGAFQWNFQHAFQRARFEASSCTGSGQHVKGFPCMVWDAIT